MKWKGRVSSGKRIREGYIVTYSGPWKREYLLALGLQHMGVLLVS